MLTDGQINKTLQKHNAYQTSDVYKTKHCGKEINSNCESDNAGLHTHTLDHSVRLLCPLRDFVHYRTAEIQHNSSL